MKSWFGSIVSYINGTNDSRNNSPRERSFSEMEAGETNSDYVARYTTVTTATKHQTTSALRHGSNPKGKGKTMRRRHSSSSDGPALPISIHDDVGKHEPRLGVLDPNVMTPSIKKHSRSKAKRRKKNHAHQSRRIPNIEGLECTRPVATERCFMIKHQRQVYYIFHRESSAFKSLLTLIEARLTELHRIKLLYWPARSNIDGSPVREALLHTLWMRIMLAEFETMRNSNALASTLLTFALNTPAEVPYPTETGSPRSPMTALATSESSGDFLSSQTYLESMLPAPVLSSSDLQPQGADGAIHKRQILAPSQISDDTIIHMDSGILHPNLRDDEEDSGDGKIHKHRVDRKRQEALQRRREIAKKQFPDQFQRFLALPVEKRLDVIKRLEAKRIAMNKGGRVVLRSGIGGNDAKKGDMDVLIRGMKAFVDDDSDASSDFSYSSTDSDYSDSASESCSSSGYSDDGDSSSSSNAQEMQPLNLGTRLQPPWLESACDNISSKENLVSDEVRKWYRHHYQSNINSWVAVDATIAYILLHQAGTAVNDLGLVVQ